MTETPLPKPNVPFDMVWIPGGEFMMGSAESDREAADDEKPAHRVRLSGVWRGKTEVSNADYRRVDPKHEGKDDLPVTNVSWDEAKAFCSHYELELPTEAQWEYAARGTDGRRYPWGDQAPDAERAAFDKSFADSPDPVGAHPKGAGPFGTLDQASNVWEWVQDCYDAKLYGVLAAKGLAVDPVVDQKDCSLRVLRGGSFNGGARNLRCAVRDWGPPDYRSRLFGFRCVRGSRRQPGD